MTERPDSEVEDLTGYAAAPPVRSAYPTAAEGGLPALPDLDPAAASDATPGPGYGDTPAQPAVVVPPYEPPTRRAQRGAQGRGGRVLTRSAVPAVSGGLILVLLATLFGRFLGSGPGGLAPAPASGWWWAAAAVFGVAVWWTLWRAQRTGRLVRAGRRYWAVLWRGGLSYAVIVSAGWAASRGWAEAAGTGPVSPGFIAAEYAAFVLLSLIPLGVPALLLAATPAAWNPEKPART